MLFKILPYQNIFYIGLLNPNILQLANSSVCLTYDLSSVKYTGILGKKKKNAL